MTSLYRIITAFEMEYFEFLDKLIDDSILAVQGSYSSVDNKTVNRLDGYLKGYEACRGKMPEEIVELYKESNPYVAGASRNEDVDGFWWFNCYSNAILWVMNVVSAILVNGGLPPLLDQLPTYMGTMKAHLILNRVNG